MLHRAMARVNALTLGGGGPRSLPGMEAHGKREDKSSRERATSRRRPIVFGSLNLRAAYETHVKGARQNTALKKPVLHMIMKFPDACLASGKDAPAPYRGLSERERKKLMLAQSVEFADRCYGGKAVFAGRVDRDEAGELNVDIFMSPRYEKRTKTGMVTDWISTTKHGKDLARKHQAAITKRMPGGDADLTHPRAIGIALQEELAAYHHEVNGITIVRERKDGRKPDWRTIEDWKDSKDAERNAKLAEAARDAAIEKVKSQQKAAVDAAQLAREAEGRRIAAEEAAEAAYRRCADAEVAAKGAEDRRVRDEADAKEAVRRRQEAEAETVKLRDRANAARLASESAVKAKADAESKARAIIDATTARDGRVTSAYKALEREIREGTLIRRSDGKIGARDIDAIRRGSPEIDQAVRSAMMTTDALAKRKAVVQEEEADLARLKASIERDEAQVVSDLREVQQYRDWLRDAQKAMLGYLARLQGWLRRPDLPEAARDAARELSGEGNDIQTGILRNEEEAIRRFERRRDRRMDNNAPSDPEQPTEEDSGPGL